MVELDSYNSSSSVSSITVDLQTGSSSPRSNYVCVAGTLGSTSTNELCYYKITNVDGSYSSTDSARHDYLVNCPYTTSHTRSVDTIAGGKLNQFYQGNTGYNNSVSGERFSFIIWICDSSTNSLPYNQLLVTAWNASQYPISGAGWNMLPHWAHSRTNSYGYNLKIIFYNNLGSIMGRVKSWKWAGE